MYYYNTKQYTWFKTKTYSFKLTYHFVLVKLLDFATNESELAAGNS